MNEFKQDRRTLTKISLALNIVFICGTIFIVYKFYPKSNQISFPTNKKSQLFKKQNLKTRILFRQFFMTLLNLKSSDNCQTQKPTQDFQKMLKKLFENLFGNFQKTQQEFLFVFLPTLLKLKFVGF